MSKNIINAIESGFAIITVNTRLARHLKLTFDEYQMKNNQRGWISPKIAPLSDWIRSVWNDLWIDKSALSKIHSETIWESIVAADRNIPMPGILNVRGIVKPVSAAYSIIKSYRIPFPERDIYLTEEGRALNRWILEYEKKLNTLGFIDMSEMTDQVIESIHKKGVPAPKKIIIAGFQELNPQTKSLLEAIIKTGCVLDFWPCPPERLEWEQTKTPEFHQKVRVREYNDPTEEVVQLARWIRQIYMPGKRIGIVVPELEKYRMIIEREFSAELNPQSVLPWQKGESVYNVSLGKTLLEEPIISSGIDIISMDGSEIDIDKISSILRTPFIDGGEKEYIGRGKLEYVLRKKNYWKISPMEALNVIYALQADLPIIERLFKLIIEEISFSKTKEYPNFWGRHFNELLKELGWNMGGDKGLKSVDYQAMEAWNKALSDLASLDNILGKISRSDAVYRIKRIIEDTIHQPETPDSPIQVMGILEAAGFYFDHLWIVGTIEDAVPMKAAPNPFLSISLQKRFNTPHSSPEREFEFSKKAVFGLLSGSPDIVVSFPITTNETESRLSPLFRTFEKLDKDACFISDSFRLHDIVQKHSETEKISLKETIPISEEEKKNIHGGTRLIKDQSACPFRAFAIFRLNAMEWPEPVPGFHAKERGDFTHKALTTFWSNVKTWERLKELFSKNELNTLVMEAVKNALNTSMNSIYPFSKQYLELEREKLTSLIYEWLLQEKIRPPFNVIEMEDSKRKIIISGLELKIRIDRIDKLEEGGEIVIDYKTGICARRDWLTNRPKEPQLLIYSLTGDYKAVALGMVRTGACKFEGVSKKKGLLPGITIIENDKWIKEKGGYSNWDSMMADWKKVIENLALNFIEGNIAADPTDRDSNKKGACEYCHLSSLCRIDEATA